MPSPSKITALLQSFVNARTAAELAGKFCQLDREHDDAKADGRPTDELNLLCGICERTGLLRFPDEWENAVASVTVMETA